VGGGRWGGGGRGVNGRWLKRSRWGGAEVGGREESSWCESRDLKWSRQGEEEEKAYRTEKQSKLARCITGLIKN